MDKQNVTLSISKDVLQKAKIRAIEQNMSLSNLLTQALIDIVEQADQYELAKERQLAWLQQGFDMGTQGKISWTREELHER
jgi:hypothetical protein